MLVFWNTRIQVVDFDPLARDAATLQTIVGNETYPRGGHDIWLSDLELQTAVEIDITEREDPND